MVSGQERWGWNAGIADGCRRAVAGWRVYPPGCGAAAGPDSAGPKGDKSTGRKELHAITFRLPVKIAVRAGGTPAPPPFAIWIATGVRSVIEPTGLRRR